MKKQNLTGESFNIVDDEQVNSDVVVKEDEPKGKKQSPFVSIVNALFMDPKYIYSLTAETARQNIFMVLRRLAIKYPIEANVFNDGKSNAFDVLKFWSDFLYNGVSVPRWTYTSGAAKSKVSKSDVTQDQIRLYKKHYGVTNKEFDDAMRFFPEEMITEIKDIVAFYDQLEKLKKEN